MLTAREPRSAVQPRTTMPHPLSNNLPNPESLRRFVVYAAGGGAPEGEVLAVGVAFPEDGVYADTAEIGPPKEFNNMASLKRRCRTLVQYEADVWVMFVDGEP